MLSVSESPVAVLIIAGNEVMRRSELFDRSGTGQVTGCRVFEKASHRKSGRINRVASNMLGRRGSDVKLRGEVICLMTGMCWK
jgi:hypothetical protein